MLPEPSRDPASAGSISPRRAVVLGSGGVLGFAWMIGALAALETEAGFDVRTVQQLVGTSAGSVTAALLSCGVSVDEIRRHHQGVPAPTDPPIAFDYSAGTSRALPRPRLLPGSPRLILNAVRHPRQARAAVTLAGALPAGRGTLEPIRRLVAEVAASSGLDSRWPQRPRIWLAATDYRTGRRVLFGRDREVALADAVVASCAIPAWYPPAMIDGRPYVDGGAVSNTSVDVLAAPASTRHTSSHRWRRSTSTGHALPSRGSSVHCAARSRAVWSPTLPPFARLACALSLSPRVVRILR
jgi:NTE family protein